MKEIYLITCPITDSPIAISKSDFGKFPYKVLKNPRYHRWRKEIRTLDLRPQFKLIDLVDDADLDLIYEMYLALFQGWNVRLYNFYNGPKYKVPRAIENSSIQVLKTDKFLLMDLPNLPSILGSISDHFMNKKMSARDRIIMYELILACALNSCTTETWAKVRSLSYKRAKELVLDLISSEKYDCSYLLQITDYLVNSPERKELEPRLLVKISKMSLTRILSMLNYIFAFFQHQVIFNQQVWHRAYDLRMYLLNKPEYNRKYEVVELYRELIKNRSIQISPKEFNQMTSEIQEATS